MSVITLEMVAEAATELIEGNQPPCLLYALWAGILSPQKPLGMNARQAHALRRYVKRGLPTDDPERLIHLIRKRGGDGWVYRAHAEAIINADYLYRSGQISHLERMPSSLREWIRWRHEMVRIPGVSWKVASFIGFIMWPFHCPFVPVDSHVASRLGELPLYRAGKLSRKSRPGYRTYRSLERRVYAEWRAAGRLAPIGLHHWYEWELERNPEGTEVGSHALFNAREV